MDHQSNKYSKVLINEHNFVVPLDYENEEDKRYQFFVREIVDEEYGNKGLPYLIFQGGPGYESPRPITNSGWIKKASQKYRILLLDQRGNRFKHTYITRIIIWHG